MWEHDGLVCTGETYKAYIKLTFARGASLNDPAGLFNASLDGGTRRAIDIREGDTSTAKPSRRWSVKRSPKTSPERRARAKADRISPVAKPSVRGHRGFSGLDQLHMRGGGFDPAAPDHSMLLPSAKRWTAAHTRSLPAAGLIASTPNSTNCWGASRPVQRAPTSAPDLSRTGSVIQPGSCWKALTPEALWKSDLHRDHVRLLLVRDEDRVALMSAGNALLRRDGDVGRRGGCSKQSGNEED